MLSGPLHRQPELRVSAGGRDGRVRGLHAMETAGTAVATSSAAGLVSPATLIAVTTAANPAPARAC